MSKDYIPLRGSASNNWKQYNLPKELCLTFATTCLVPRTVSAN